MSKSQGERDGGIDIDEYSNRELLDTDIGIAIEIQTEMDRDTNRERKLYRCR